MPDWEAIVREHGPAVFRTAWRVTRNAQDAEDVTQEVLLELFRSPAPPGAPCGGLLQRMAVLRAVDCLRRRRHTVPLDDVAGPAKGLAPEDEAIGNELAERLRDGLARLAPRQAAVFCLRYFEGLSYEQIAAALSVRREAVAVALHKARARLRAFLLGEVVKGERS
jgi:RNA polymerase sigma-70 factor (ECF subfamily)